MYLPERDLLDPTKVLIPYNNIVWAWILAIYCIMCQCCKLLGDWLRKFVQSRLVGVPNGVWEQPLNSDCWALDLNANWLVKWRGVKRMGRAVSARRDIQLEGHYGQISIDSVTGRLPDAYVGVEA